MLFICGIIEGISVAEILPQENMVYYSIGWFFPLLLILTLILKNLKYCEIIIIRAGSIVEGAATPPRDPPRGRVPSPGAS